VRDPPAAIAGLAGLEPVAGLSCIKLSSVRGIMVPQYRF
jgi:hypothetical protein